MAVSDWSCTALPWTEERAALKERIGGVFRRAELCRQISLHLEGLIGGAARRMAGNWPNRQAISRHSRYRRFSAARYGIKRRRAPSAGIMRSSISAIRPASKFWTRRDS